MAYNLQDPSDLDILEYEFSSISEREWSELIDYVSIDDNWKRFDKKALYLGEKYCNNPKKITPKQQLWALNVANSILSEIKLKKDDVMLEKAMENEQFSQPLRHFTLRVAWHDSGWDGHICKDPQRNHYCDGYNSLLSNRIRWQKEQTIKQEIEFAGKAICGIDYQPPCFWSMNINGTEPKNVQHVNPAAMKILHPIEEVLKPHSMYSWPFSISFNRDPKVIRTEGAYPPNLDNVRAPLFREKIKVKRSIAFIYANYSNPLSDEEREYLVVGAALISGKGNLAEFTPAEGIAQKRAMQPPKNKNFPRKNWALQFNFDEQMLVMMPYHEYLNYGEAARDHAAKQDLLDRIKVTIFEPELVHCFKYVAMDIDDDEAIYILSKMRQKLIACQNDGVIDPEQIRKKIEVVDSLRQHCWKMRGYFPSFSKLADLLLERSSGLDKLIEELKSLDSEKQEEKLVSLLENPKGDPQYKGFKYELRDLQDALKERALTTHQFLRLSLLNLSAHQFSRILDGQLSDWNNSPSRTPVDHICQNPYLLVEEYHPQENVQDAQTGEDVDSAIELFKIDIAYFPEAGALPRLDIQREIIQTDKRRLRCIIMNYLNSLVNIGDCFEEATNLENALRNYPLFYHSDKELVLPIEILKKIQPERDAFFEENSQKLKIVTANDTRYFYLRSIYDIEKKVGDKIIELLGQPKNIKKYDNLEKYILDSTQHLKANSSFDEREFQAERTFLYDSIFSERLFVLSGGPGSGKSHELLNVIAQLKAQGERCLLLAPTGKAALRLKSDSTFGEMTAQTIDKWLTQRESGMLSKAADSSINNLIIDEMSMLDLLKFWEVLRQFQFSDPAFKRLILVGDPNQLPAIGYGKVLKDILYFLKSHPKYRNNYIELTGNYRSELTGNKVIALSRAFEENGEIEEGLEGLFDRQSADKDVSAGFRAVYWEAEDELQEKLQKYFMKLTDDENCHGSLQEALFKILGFSNDGLPLKTFPTLDRFQILSPYLSGLSGVDGLNDYVQKTFKEKLPSTIADNMFKEGDKIIRTKNYYQDDELLLSNGSIGYIKGQKNTCLFFQENNYAQLKLHDIRKAEREFFELAYAITIHKSQGSGFDHLFIIIPDRIGLLSRELIYTALTRCRKSVTLFLQINTETRSKNSLLDIARKRTFTDARKTTLLLMEPFRYYSLEPEPGVYVQSRSELLIYHALIEMRDRHGKDKFDFSYEKYPINPEGIEVKIKTDFTLYCNGHIWYWEHLGLLTNRKYERMWMDVKRPTYQNYGLEAQLITSDELMGLSPEKIKNIIEIIFGGCMQSEDKFNKYSLYHFSLR